MRLGRKINGGQIEPKNTNLSFLNRGGQVGVSSQKSSEKDHRLQDNQFLQR